MVISIDNPAGVLERGGSDWPCRHLRVDRGTEAQAGNNTTKSISHIHVL